MEHFVGQPGGMRMGPLAGASGICWRQPAPAGSLARTLHRVTSIDARRHECHINIALINIAASAFSGNRMPRGTGIARRVLCALAIVPLLGCLREFHGRVVDAKTGKPKAGVRVEVYESARYYYTLERLEEGGTDNASPPSGEALLGTRTTRGDGAFSIHPVHRPSAVVMIATDDRGNGKSEPVEAEPGEDAVLRYDADRQALTLRQKLQERRRQKWRLH